MLVPISEIKVNAGRRKADPEGVQELVDSISKVGLLNPITIDREHTLIAGLHRLEAAKLLGWTEIECNVSSLEGLLAELAEVDENVVRKGLSAVEYSDLLLRRKEIYETLHPETKAGTSQAAGMNRAKGNNVGCKMHPTSKSFVQDTAEKLGVNPSTIKRQIQTAKNLTTEAKDIIRDTGTKITKKDALKLSRLEPEQQRDAASQLAAGEIKSMGEYHPAPAEEPQPPEPPMPPSVPYSLGDKHYASIEESVADLKNPDKDCSYTPDTLLADIDGFVDTFHKNFAWYNDPFCTVVFPSISPVQFNFVRQRFATIFSAMEDLLNLMERTMNK
ncbi:ParB N-terminal domain-containing protein [uncultured Oscillibacter sp.]|jgi:ParB family chromosome partitioning protein|uniref:ParB/RepB/Spo0J family partition protein n=1 Tax=uncultured Oscillibacter sp. TaxID=876091 RepID=UPI0025D94288|nr:ParB N-terminal domain-containing protein [uncultured Oscillibacter sp.]